jgi:HK97 family phage portal protein
MNFLTHTLSFFYPELRAAGTNNPENPSTPLGLFADEIKGNGQNVTENTALAVAAVYACVKVISETMALMDLEVKQRKGKFLQVDSLHPLNQLFREPSQRFNRFEWIQAMLAFALLWGNGYCKIRRGRYGDPVEFIILPAWEVTVKLTDRGRMYYEWRPSKNPTTVEIIQSGDMLHLKNLSTEGMLGISPIQVQRENLGNMEAKKAQDGAFYSNGAKAGGVLMTPGTMGGKERKNLGESFDKANSGSKNRFKTIILEEGVKYQQLTIPQNDAQFLESKKFDRSEIAGWYRVPPYKIGDHEKSTYSNIEGQERSFAKDTVVPWAIRLQQELDRKLFFTEEYDFCTHFNLDDLIKGDMKSRYEIYQIATQSAILKPIEAREQEGWNTDGMPEIDNFFMNSATTSVKKILEAPAPGTPGAQPTPAKETKPKPSKEKKAA